MNDAVEPVLVILGIDNDGKAHASRFAASEREAVERAARLMEMALLEVSDPALVATARALPEGRIYATGRGLVPFVKRELYDTLAALLPPAPPPAQAEAADAAPPPVDGDTLAAGDAPAASPEAAAGAAAAATATPPDYWAAIQVGSVVLANEVESDNGWWACEILSVGKDPNRLKARWLEFPDQPSFFVNRAAVAILPGGVTPPPRK